MSVRVYLATGRSGVRALATEGELRAPGYVVTPAMRAADPRADEEDLEYEASLLAEAHARQHEDVVVVVAADVTDPGAADDDGRVDPGPVARSRVVSLHVAEHGADADEELLWFDVTELDQVLEYLEG